MKKEARIVLYLGVLLIFGYIGYSTWLYYSMGYEQSGIEVNGKVALHWHPYLYIYLCGKEYKLAFETGMEELHIHKDRNMVHLGEGGTIANPTEYFRLKKAWDAFNMTYTDTCLMDYCNGNRTCNDGKDNQWHMTVNGVQNDTLWSYPMRDGDKIIVRYE